MERLVYVQLQDICHSLHLNILNLLQIEFAMQICIFREMALRMTIFTA